jgi:hypothetical protein
MPIVRAKVLHAAGCSEVDIPDDILVKDLIDELLVALSLPSIKDVDGQPLEYRLDSRSLGRRLLDQETITSAHVSEDDTLMLTVGVLAGSPLLEQKSRIAIVESSVGIEIDNLEVIDIRALMRNEAALRMTLHAYRTTLVQLETAREDLKLCKQQNENLQERLREKKIATLLLVFGQIQTGFGINLITIGTTGGWLVLWQG